MRNAYEVLRQKENELNRLRREVAALRIVAALLTEEDGAQTSPKGSALRSATDSALGLGRKVSPPLKRLVEPLSNASSIAPSSS